MNIQMPQQKAIAIVAPKLSETRQPKEIQAKPDLNTHRQAGLSTFFLKVMLSRLLDCCLLLFTPPYLAVHFLYMNIRLCCLNFDPIYDAPSGITCVNYRSKLPAYRRERAKIAEKTLHRYFTLHVGVFLLIFLDTMVILATNGFNYSGHQLPELFTHRMFPDYYVTQGDQYILSATVGFGGIALVLWRRPWLEDRYAMYFVYGPKRGERHLIVDGKGKALRFEAFKSN